MLLGVYLDRAERVVSEHSIGKTPFFIGEKVIVFRPYHQECALQPKWMGPCEITNIREG